MPNIVTYRKSFGRAYQRLDAATEELIAAVRTNKKAIDPYTMENLIYHRLLLHISNDLVEAGNANYRCPSVFARVLAKAKDPNLQITIMWDNKTGIDASTFASAQRSLIRDVEKIIRLAEKMRVLCRVERCHGK